MCNVTDLLVNSFDIKNPIQFISQHFIKLLNIIHNEIRIIKIFIFYWNTQFFYDLFCMKVFCYFLK